MKQDRARADMFIRRLSRSGHPNCEAYCRDTSGCDISGFEGSITGSRHYREEGVSVRVEAKRRIGSSFTERVDQKHLDQAIALAAGQLDFMESDDGQVLYPGKSTAYDDARFSRDLQEIPVERKQEFVLKLERAARGLDAKVLSVPISRYVETHRSVTVVNALGMRKIQRSSTCAAVLQVSVGNTRQVRTGTFSAADRYFYHLSPLRMAQEAVMRALEKMNPRGIDSGTYSVVFSQEAASQLLGAFFLSPYAPWFGENVLKGRSPLAGKIGELTASPEITIYDNPRNSFLHGRSFDDEGVPARRLVLIQDGVLKGFANSVYAASRLGGAPTGHGMRGGYAASVVTGLHAPSLTNGTYELDALLDQCGRGIYINELHGLHAGIDVLAGCFSLSAGGLLIEGGKLKKSVGTCVIAGSIFDLLNNVTAKGQDRREDALQRFSSPSILVRSLSVSA